MHGYENSANKSGAYPIIIITAIYSHTTLYATPDGAMVGKKICSAAGTYAALLSLIPVAAWSSIANDLPRFKLVSTCGKDFIYHKASSCFRIFKFSFQAHFKLGKAPMTILT